MRRTRRKPSGHRFDTIGSVLSALAIGELVLGIHEGPEKGWSDPLTIVVMTVGVVCIVAFVAWERRQTEPLLDISAFRDRGLASGTVTLLIVFAVMFGVFLVLFPYFQAVLGWTALRSAAALLPMMLVMMPMSAIAPKVEGASRPAPHDDHRRHGLRQRSGDDGTADPSKAATCRASWPAADRARDGPHDDARHRGDHRDPPTREAGCGLGAERHVAELGGAVGIALLGSVPRPATRRPSSPYWPACHPSWPSRRARA